MVKIYFLTILIKYIESGKKEDSWKNGCLENRENESFKPHYSILPIFHFSFLFIA
jgi:hypothetical protein